METRNSRGRRVDVNDNVIVTRILRSERSRSASPVRRLQDDAGLRRARDLWAVRRSQRSSPGHVIVEVDSSGTSSGEETDEAGNSQIKWFGNYSPFFGGMCVIGPGRIGLVVSTIYIISLLLLLGLLHQMIVRYIGSWVPWLGYTCWTIFFYLFLRISTTDPGIIPKNVTESHHPQSSCRGCRGMNCRKCGAVRPPRAYHCKFCDVCISYQDIHLHCCGTCVGERNSRFYFLLNAAVVILSSFLLTNGVILVTTVGKRSELVLPILSIVNGSIMLFIPNLGIFMFLFRFYLIAYNRTFREEQQLVNGLPIVRANYVGCYWSRFKDYLYPPHMMGSYFRKGNRVSPLEQSSGWTPLWLDRAWNRRVIPNEQNIRESRWSTVYENEATDDLFSNANSAKRRSHYSDPLLSDGELKNLPMTRQRHLLHSRFTDRISCNVAHHQAMIDLPKATMDLHFQQKTKQPGTLSVGDIPHAKWNQNNQQNEIIYEARAQQMLAVVQMVENRDMHGLIDLWNRVDIGTLMGLGRMEPESLQIVELENGNASLVIMGRRGGGYRADIAQRRLAGITQMIAAGLMSRTDGIRIRDIFYTPPAVIAQALQRQQAVVFHLHRPPAWSFPSQRRNQFQLPFLIIQDAQQQRMARRRSRRNLSSSLVVPAPVVRIVTSSAMPLVHGSAGPSNIRLPTTAQPQREEREDNEE